ncbi:nuclear inhibitor of protein phosphatase 1 [Hydra vulgaris]|uniref:Nuclear inhibitor of protein phosphatase 1 n=1 Tax=Hydra vulgaris TaxID=6087 RepID=T2MDP6_HYDVU|nr:nuclear inhibitor of protein phosphatase 1 [Hydra vulgaris]
MADVSRIKRKVKSLKPVQAPIPVKPNFEPPKWAGKPPPGMHLDVSKDGKLIEKFIVDGKTHFFFGRQKEYIDFTVDHTSCSRIHAVMVYHKPLQRMFLIDLGSTHGTFLGNTRLEPNCPMQLPVDENFHFGASTRTWALREKLATGIMDNSLNSSINGVDENETTNLSLLGLPEAENDLNDLTEYNTAHNRRVTILPIDEGSIVNPLKRKRKKSCNVTFTTEDEIINPEDIDPTVGRFRNLISTEIIAPNKINKQILGRSTEIGSNKVRQDFQVNNLYNDSSILEPASSATTLMTPKITSAPDVESPDVMRPILPALTKTIIRAEIIEEGPQEPTRKKYMKEAWPGRKPKANNLLSV